MEYTKGPWKVSRAIRGWDGNVVYYQICSGKGRVSSTGVFGRRGKKSVGEKYKDKLTGEMGVKPFISADECLANAALIAAAPELLEALMFIVNDAKPGEDAVLSVKGYNKACKAIAKAEGRA